MKAIRFNRRTGLRRQPIAGSKRAVTPAVRPVNMRTNLNSSQPPVAKTAVRRDVSVWLVEDNHTFRHTVARVLGQVEGLECPQQFSNAEDASHPSTALYDQPGDSYRS